MALYVVVHHRQDPHQPWANDWLDDRRVNVIKTTTEIGNLCEQSRQRNERVFVHRCAWGGITPTVCCCVQVAQVVALDRRTSLVTFAHAVPLMAEPQVLPRHGLNFYVTEAV
jgi:hypothetical protein